MLNFVVIYPTMASQNKTPDASFIFGWQYQPSFRLVDESTTTVPDMVLSMKEIYERYAVTGDISSLPGSVRPYVEDPDDSPYRESPEEPLDVMFSSRQARMIAEDMMSQDQEKSDDSHPDKEGDKEERSDDAKPDESGDKPSDDS